MKICKTEEEYIKAIALAVQRCCNRYGYLPSVLIAQSCLENGYGIPDYWDNPQIAALLAYVRNSRKSAKDCSMLSYFRKLSVIFTGSPSYSSGVFFVRDSPGQTEY